MEAAKKQRNQRTPLSTKEMLITFQSFTTNIYRIYSKNI